MNTMRRDCSLLSLVALLSAACYPAITTATECSLAVTDMPFGPYAPQSGAPAESTSEVTVSCRDDGNTDTVDYRLTLSGGNSGTDAQRRMTGTADPAVQYNVYVDASHTTIWGDDTGAGVSVSGSITPPAGGEAAQSHLAHGQIPANQTELRPGSYGDSLIVTIFF